MDFGFFLGSLDNTAACGNRKAILWFKYSFGMENAGKIKRSETTEYCFNFRKGLLDGELH